MVQRRLEQFFACTWLQLVASLFRQGQDDSARWIWHELSRHGKFQRWLELQQSGRLQLWSELYATGFVNDVLQSQYSADPGSAAGSQRSAVGCRTGHSAEY